MRTPKTLTDVQWADLCDRFEKGDSLAKLSKRSGVSTSTIKRKLIAMGKTMRSPSDYKILKFKKGKESLVTVSVKIEESKAELLRKYGMAIALREAINNWLGKEKT